MKRLTPLTPDTARGSARERLTHLVDRHGSVGDMVATMAHSPALLQGYLDLSRAMKRAGLPREVAEKISLAVQEWLGCQTCLASHTEAARSLGMSEADISLARQGTARDRREAGLIGYALQVLTEPDRINDADLAELREHGWSDRSIADVVGIVALNQLTGSFNLVAGLEPALDAGDT